MTFSLCEMLVKKVSELEMRLDLLKAHLHTCETNRPKLISICFYPYDFSLQHCSCSPQFLVSIS